MKQIELGNLQGFIGGSETVIAKPAAPKAVKSKLDEYKEKYEKGESFNISFSNQEWSKGLWKTDGDTTIWLKNEDMSDGNGIYLRNSALSRQFTVKVSEIDEETKTVYVSFRLAQEPVRKEVIGLIQDALKKNEHLMMRARIVWFDTKHSGNRCYVDIMGLGIRGTLFIDQWDHTYVENFSDVTKIGDVINVAVTGERKGKPGEEPAFICSRKETIEKTDDSDKWKNVEELFPLHSRVVVQCKKKYPSNFVGKVLGKDNWYAYCYYPDTNSFVNVVEGVSYRGFVKAVSAEKKQLRIKVIEMVPDEVASRI